MTAMQILSVFFFQTCDLRTALDIAYEHNLEPEEILSLIESNLDIISITKYIYPEDDLDEEEC